MWLYSTKATYMTVIKLHLLLTNTLKIHLRHTQKDTWWENASQSKIREITNLISTFLADQSIKSHGQ